MLILNLGAPSFLFTYIVKMMGKSLETEKTKLSLKSDHPHTLWGCEFAWTPELNQDAFPESSISTCFPLFVLVPGKGSVAHALLVHVIKFYCPA